MRRQLLLIVLLYISLLFAAYVLLDYMAFSDQLNEDFPIAGIFSFNLIFTILLMLTLTYFSVKKGTKDRVGFFYLISVVLKPVLFLIIFKSLFFGATPLTKNEAILILFPLLLSLLFEVVYCAKILKR